MFTRDWENKTFFNTKRNGIINDYRYTVKACKQQRDEEIKAAAIFKNEDHLINEANKKYDRGIADAINTTCKKLDTLRDEMMKSIMKHAATAPSDSTLNYINAFNLRDSATNKELEAAFDAVSGNMSAVLAFASVAKKFNPNDNPLGYVEPIPVYTLEELESTLYRHFENKKRSIRAYVESDFAILSTNDYEKLWTPVCFFLEFCGVYS